MNEKMKIVRFWIAVQLIKLAILIIDKTTIEGLSLAVSIEDWVNYLTNPNQPVGKIK